MAHAVNAGRVPTPVSSLAPPPTAAPAGDDLDSDLDSVDVAGAPPKPHVPLVTHLIPPPVRERNTPLHAVDGNQTSIHQAAPQPKVTAEAAIDESEADPAALRMRIRQLETRASSAEQSLAELHTSFTIFAQESRKQTNTLLGALERLLKAQEAA